MKNDQNLSKSEQWEIDLEKVDNYLIEKHLQTNIQILVIKNISEYQELSQILENQILQIQKLLQVKYENKSYGQIFSYLYFICQQKFSDLQKIITYQPQQQYFDNFEDFNTETKKNFEQIFFQGELVQNAISYVKFNQNYLSQKKVVHVFTKKGYGLQKYSQYLLKRKLDEKQWNFYINNLKNDNNYQKYLNSATLLTLNTIINFINQTKKGMEIICLLYMNSPQFINIVNKLNILSPTEANCYRKSMRIIYDLNSDQKPSCRDLINLINKLLTNRKNRKNCQN